MSDSDQVRDNQVLPAEKVGRWFSVALLLAAAFVTTPGVFRPMGPPGIDPGWVWAVNHAAQEGWIFGNDIVFTYGPLAFLIVPLDVSHNLVTANAFYMIVQALFAAVLIALFLRQVKSGSTAGSAAVSAVLFVCARHQGLNIEAQFLIVLGLLALYSILEDHRLPLSVASALAGILFLVKMSLGIAALAILAVAVTVSIWIFKRSLSFAFGLLLFPATVGLLSVLTFDHPASFFRWAQLSLEFVSGYSVANSILGPTSQVVVGAMAVVGWFVATRAVRSDRALLACNLVFAPVVLIQFRLAFVRQDTHQLQFIPFMLALVALSTLLVRRRRQLGVHLVAFACLIVGGSITNLIDPVERGLLPSNLLAGGSGARTISKIVNIDETKQELAKQSRHNLAPLRLSDDWLTLIQTSEHGVGTLPWEIQYCPANNLEWNPTPTLQLYSAYTRKLDLWSAEKYRGTQTPEFIINEYVPVGKRHQMIDAPATWREIFIRYRMIAAILGPTQTALLEKRQEIPTTSYEVLGTGTLVLGTSGIDIPPSEGLVFAEFDLRLNTLGRVQKSIFRVPLIYLVMYRVSGEQTYYRLTPGTAINGVLINRFPKDFMGYRRLWQGIIDDPVVRIVVAGPGLPFFRSPVEITWRELKIQAPTPQSPSFPEKN